MNHWTPMVYIVDDDDAIRDALGRLLQADGLSTKGFASATEFLNICEPSMRGCLLLDVQMPQISGLEVQRLLSEREINIPIIFLTGYGDVPMSSQAFRNGAFDFLEKPFENSELLERVRGALSRDAEQWHERMRRAQLIERFSQLTTREKEVLQLVSAGYSSKQVAKALAISNRTVDVYRAHIMQKMGADSLADLVAMALELESRFVPMDHLMPA
jgi:two-component system response regulator FixJ